MEYNGKYRSILNMKVGESFEWTPRQHKKEYPTLKKAAERNNLHFRTRAQKRPNGTKYHRIWKVQSDNQAVTSKEMVSMEDTHSVVCRVKLKDLSFNPLNPATRTIPSKLRGMVRSIKKMGIIQPPIVTSDLVIVDGHRRITAYHIIDKDGELDVIVLPHSMKKDKAKFNEIFVEASSNMNKISSSQELEMYLKPGGRHLVRQKTLNDIEALKAVGGNNFLLRIKDKGHSPTTYMHVLRLYKEYTNVTTNKELRKVLYYVVNVSNARRFRAALDYCIPVEALHAAINNKEELSLAWN